MQTACQGCWADGRPVDAPSIVAVAGAAKIVVDVGTVLDAAGVAVLFVGSRWGTTRFEARLRTQVEAGGSYVQVESLMG